MKGYVPLRRGILDHLPSMTSDQFKLYGALLALAKNSGPSRGVVEIGVRDLGTAVGWAKSKTHRVLSQLSPKYITVEGGKNQHALSQITIKKFDTVSPQCGTADGTAELESGTADAKNGTASPENGTAGGTADQLKPNEINTIQTPERVERIKVKDKKEETPLTPLEEIRRPHGEFGHALLTLDEFGKLFDHLGPHLPAYIERFDSWVHEAPKAKTSGGVRRCERNPYLSIRNWFNRDKAEGKLPKVTHGHSEDPNTDAIAAALRDRAQGRADRNVATQVRRALPDVPRDPDEGEGSALVRTPVRSELF